MLGVATGRIELLDLTRIKLSSLGFGGIGGAVGLVGGSISLLARCSSTSCLPHQLTATAL